MQNESSYKQTLYKSSLLVTQWTGRSELESLAAMSLRTLDSFTLQILPGDGARVPSATQGAREFHIDPLQRTARARAQSHTHTHTHTHGTTRSQ